MSEEKESDNNSGLARPNKLPPLKTEEVKARAQAILKVRGFPPYDQNNKVIGEEADILAAQKIELEIISDFVYYWLPYLVVPKKNA